MLDSILLLFNLGTGEIIVIVLVILLLFGGKKIPELMKGVGKGVKSFKQGLNEVEDEIKKASDDDTKGKSASNPADKYTPFPPATLNTTACRRSVPKNNSIRNRLTSKT